MRGVTVNWKTRLSYILGINLVLLLVLTASPSSQALAATGDETTVGVLTLESTFKCISVYANFTGDNNANNSAVLEYRQGSGAWKRGMEMCVDRYPSSPWKNQWRVSIVGLNAATTYQVRVTFTDANGVTGTNPVTGSVATWEDIIPPSLGNSYYVSVTGNDGADGSFAHPWLTIGHAATTAAGGSKIRVMPGTYWNESSITPNSGTSQSYTTIEAYDPANKPLIT